MPAGTSDIHKYRAKKAALTRSRPHNDPELIAADNGLQAAKHNAGAHSVLNSVQARINRESPKAVMEAAVCRGVPIEIRLIEAVELLTYVIRAVSDRPLELVAALREQVDRIDTVSPTD